MSDSRLEHKSDVPQVDWETISNSKEYKNLELDSVARIEGTGYSLIKTLDEDLYIVSDRDKLGTGQSSIGVFKGWQVVKGEKQDILFNPAAVKIQEANLQIWNEQKAAKILYPKETKPVVIEEITDKTGKVVRYAYLITKRLPNKSLADKKEKVDPDVSKLPTLKKFGLITEILKVVKYMHEKKWLHGDLTGENILLDEKFTPYLSDFGNAKKLGATISISGVGSAGHLASEMIIGTPSPDQPEEKITSFNERSDIFSLAPVLMSILGAHDPLRLKLAARLSSQNRDEQDIAEVKENFDITGIAENMLKDVSMNEKARDIFINAIIEHLEKMGNNDNFLRPQSIDHSIKFFETAKKVLENYQLKKSTFSIFGVFSPRDDVTLLRSVAEKEKFTLKA